MLAKLRPRLTYANVTATIALFVALGGTAYAVDTVGSADIIDESILSQDVKDGEVRTSDLADLGVTNAKLAADAVTTLKLANGAVTALKLGANAVTSPAVRDFGLRNEDIGVLFAEVTSTPSTVTLSNSSGGVSATRIGSAGSGQFSVDFGRNITDCTAVATIGRADTQLSSGQVSVADRLGNVEAVSVRTLSSTTGAAADRPFRLVVVC
jgi:hypothetical protein